MRTSSTYNNCLIVSDSYSLKIRQLRNQLPACLGQERFGLRRVLTALEKQPNETRLAELATRMQASMRPGPTSSRSRSSPSRSGNRSGRTTPPNG